MGRLTDYWNGRWCGECEYGVVQDPPCCTQPEKWVECPHWSPGSITIRKGCTACADEAERRNS